MNHVLKRFSIAVSSFLIGSLFAIGVNLALATETVPSSPPPDAAVSPVFDGLTIERASNDTFEYPRSGWLDVKGGIKNSYEDYVTIARENKGLWIPEGNIRLSPDPSGNNLGYISVYDTDMFENPSFHYSIRSHLAWAEGAPRSNLNGFYQTVISDEDVVDHGSSSKGQVTLEIGTPEEKNIIGELAGWHKTYGRYFGMYGEYDDSDAGKIYGAVAYKGWDPELEFDSSGIGARGHGYEYGVLGTSAQNEGYGVGGFVALNDPMGNPITAGSGVAGGTYSSAGELSSMGYLGTIVYSNIAADPVDYYGIFTDGDGYIQNLITPSIVGPLRDNLSIYSSSGIDVKTASDKLLTMDSGKMRINTANGLELTGGTIKAGNSIELTSGNLTISSGNLDMLNGTLRVKDIIVTGKITCADGTANCAPNNADDPITIPPIIIDPIRPLVPTIYRNKRERHTGIREEATITANCSDLNFGPYTFRLLDPADVEKSCVGRARRPFEGAYYVRTQGNTACQARNKGEFSVVAHCVGTL